jgi:hypothetical protein
MHLFHVDDVIRIMELLADRRSFELSGIMPSRMEVTESLLVMRR